MHHLAAMLGNFYHLRLRTGECTVSSWEVSGVMNERALPGGWGAADVEGPVYRGCQPNDEPMSTVHTRLHGT